MRNYDDSNINFHSIQFIHFIHENKNTINYLNGWGGGRGSHELYQTI